MKSWLSSPVAVNYLLSRCKDGASYQKTYLQIYRDLKIKKGFTSINQLFVSPSSNAEKQYDTSDISIMRFGESNDGSQRILKWIKQNGSFSQVDIEKYVLPTPSAVLCNINVFKGSWKSSQSGPVMKVHNSFSYTEDIKYEARLIELPMQDDDFKLVIVLPNQVSSIRGLFSRLVEEGMEAAVRCVQPLFTFCTALEAPSIEFSSANRVCFSENNRDVLKGTQIGNVQINEAGTNICVFTLLSFDYDNSTDAYSDDEEISNTHSPYYFAVLYKNTAIFTGRYYVQSVK